MKIIRIDRWKLLDIKLKFVVSSCKRDSSSFVYWGEEYWVVIMGMCLFGVYSKV